MVGLTGSMSIDGLEIHHPAGVTIGLRGDHHPVLPDGGLIEGHPPDHPQPLVPVQPRLHRVTPVESNLSRLVSSIGLSFRINMQTDRWTVIKQGQLLSLAHVKCRGGKPVQDVLFQPWEVSCSGITG